MPRRNKQKGMGAGNPHRSDQLILLVNLDDNILTTDNDISDMMIIY